MLESNSIGSWDQFITQHNLFPRQYCWPMNDMDTAQPCTNAHLLNICSVNMLTGWALVH